MVLKTVVLGLCLACLWGLLFFWRDGWRERDVGPPAPPPRLACAARISRKTLRVGTRPRTYLCNVMFIERGRPARPTIARVAHFIPNTLTSNLFQEQAHPTTIQFTVPRLACQQKVISKCITVNLAFPHFTTIMLLTAKNTY